MIARSWTLQGEIDASVNIGKILAKIGLAEDIALHQGFCMVESWAYAEVIDDHLVVLQDAYSIEATKLDERGW